MRRITALIMAFAAAAGCHDTLTELPAPAMHAAALLDPVSSPTNAATAVVSGTALPGATVDFAGGSSVVQASADSAGRFSAQVPLNTASGAATVNDVVVTYVAGGVQSRPALARIVHDSVAPFPAFITVNPSPTAQNPATVAGNAEANSSITVYGAQAAASARADLNGDFSVLVQLLPNSVNYLTIDVTDAAGNRSPLTQLQVIHDDTPPAAAMQSLLRAYHDGTRLVVEGNFGCVEPNATVTVEDVTALNPASTVAASASGEFRATIVSGANGNTIEVSVTDTAGNASVAPHTNVTASLSWAAPAVAGSPPQNRAFAAADYDYPNDRVFIFGGLDASGALGSGAFASIAPGFEAWTALLAVSAPSPRCGHSVHFDGSGKMYVFGGYDPAGPTHFQDTHALDVSAAGSETWMPIPAAGAPPARAFHASAFDPVTGKMIVFGGEGDSGLLSDLWEFNPSPAPAWTQLAASGSAPPALAGACAAMDPSGQRFVLFGGRDSTGQRSANAWLLDLSASPAWTLIGAQGALAARDNACAAFDRIGSRLFVFGGDLGASRAADLHVLDLSASSPSWTQASPGGASPAAREGACMIFDLRRLREIVFGGGSDGASGSLYADLHTLE